MEGSSREGGLGEACGYLEVSSSLSRVRLVVSSYDYPRLLPLINELPEREGVGGREEWGVRWGSYLRALPPYYLSPLRRALVRCGASGIAAALPQPPQLHPHLQHKLKRTQVEARLSFERTCGEVRVLGLFRLNPRNHLSLIPSLTFSDRGAGAGEGGGALPAAEAEVPEPF